MCCQQQQELLCRVATWSFEKHSLLGTDPVYYYFYSCCWLAIEMCKITRVCDVQIILNLDDMLREYYSIGHETRI